MMNYKYVAKVASSDRRDGVIIRIDDDGTTRFIPQDERNSDWRAYQEWLAQGNVPLPQDSLTDPAS